MLNDLDARLTYQECNLIFKKVDTSKDNLVSMEEWKTIFNNYDFRSMNKGSRIILDLQEIVKANKISLEKIFNKYDKGKKGKLDFLTFSNLIKEIAPNIKTKDL